MLSPTLHADAIGQAAVDRLSDPVRKTNGIYLTPEAIARYMASHITVIGTSLRVLDPAAGSGILPCALIERLVSSPRRPENIHVVAYEIRPELHDTLVKSLAYATRWASEWGTTVTVETYCADYVTAYANQPLVVEGTFDLIIANPPYFKLGSRDPRQMATRHLVPPQPNIYSLFLSLSARALRRGGEMVYIVPRSFASGVYFKPFRRDFFARVQPRSIHLFGSRRQAFKRDSVLQENIILHGARFDGWPHSTEITMSHSDGIDDLGEAQVWSTTFAELVDPKAPGQVLRLPQSREGQELMQTISQLPETISSIGLSISTGPIVAFRARELIHDYSTEATVPLLWLHHVKPGAIEHPVPKRTGQYVATSQKKLLVRTQNCVVLRRFSAKDEPRRLTAAPLLARDFPCRWVGIENHLNYLYRSETALSEDETTGLTAILNSPVMDRYFRAVSGNTQVGAAELRALPLPSMVTIGRIGQQIQDAGYDDAAIDELILREAQGLEGVAAD